ncbi:MAG: SpoIID/LytB domain-containing protein [Spirochaetia bacterium]|nr:SpoIID/LytB domain-containing protein [Spirochaetia bacterium]
MGTYKKKYLIIFTVSNLILFNQCASPKGWKGSSYLYGSGSYGSLFAGKKTVRVKIHEGKPVEIDFMGEFEVVQIDRRRFQKKGTYLPNSTVHLSGKNKKFKIGKKIYSGDIAVQKSAENFLYINHVSEDSYLISVVGHEMNDSWPQEALKAQTVVARTYLYQRMLENSRKEYDVDGTTNNQVYGGKLKDENNLELAVQKTSREVIMYNGTIADVFFHSSCGGHTEDSESVWQKPHPYLIAKKTGHCQDAKDFQWSETFSKHTIETKLKIKDLKNIKVKSRTRSGRAETVVFTAKNKSREILSEDLRKNLGLKSTFFDMRVNSDKVEVSGRGYGHGVGMCQWGSKNLADNKKVNYRQILRFYFPNTRVGRMSFPMVV